MRFGEQILEEIKTRIPVSQVVGRHVVWDRRKSQPAKGDHWACCPFHSEKTPSFHADDRKGRYYCFGCGASGDHFKFLSEKEGLSFPEAVERLAEEAGVQLPKRSPGEAQRDEKASRAYQVLELAAQFFEDQLKSAEGAGAAAYLEARGLERTTIETFRLGFAPGDRRALKTHLAANGVTPEEMVETGLVISGEDIAVPYDRFRDRVMFPITDVKGRVIAFGGRALKADVPAKYLNSPEGALFHKRRVLYNLDRARGPAYDSGAMIVAEGYMDVIALWAAGFRNAVAPLGTALTEDQIALLWRFADEPVLCFDGDEAGLKAAYRVLDTALALIRPGRSLRFALLPPGRDPDDVLRDEGADAMAALIEGARPLVDMVWAREMEGRDLSTPERRAALEARMREVVAMITDEEVRAHYRDQVNERLKALWRPRAQGPARGQFEPGRRGGAGGRGGFSQKPRFTPATASLKTSALVRQGPGPVPQREMLLVLTVVNHPGLLEQFAEEFSEIELAAPALDSLRREILDIAAQSGPLDRATLLDQLEGRGVSETVARMERGLTHHSDWFVHADTAPSDAETGWLHTLSLHRKALTLQKELRAAERAFGQDGSQENFARLCDIREAMSSTEGHEAMIEGFGEASQRAGGERR